MMNLFAHIGRLLRRYASVGIMVCLLLSTVLWYIIKLSYTYTAEIPFAINVEGSKVKVNCLVEASGYRLVAHRYVLNGSIDVTLSDVEAMPSAVNKDGYILNPFAVQNIISLNNSDLKVISVGELPEIIVTRKSE